MSKQKRVEAMEIKRESIAKKRPGHVLYRMFKMLSDVILTDEPLPEPKIRHGVKCLGIDLAVLQESFRIEGIGIGIKFFSSQKRPYS